MSYALRPPTKAEAAAIAAGKAMEGDPGYWDPDDMRGIGWDDILEGIEDDREVEKMITVINKYSKFCDECGHDEAAAWYFNGLQQLNKQKAAAKADAATRKHLEETYAGDADSEEDVPLSKRAKKAPTTPTTPMAPPTAAGGALFHGFNADHCRTFRPEVENAITAMLAGAGGANPKVDLGKMKYTPTSLTFTMKLAVQPANDARPPEAAAFEAEARKWNSKHPLTPIPFDAYGKEFTAEGKDYTIVGVVPARSKYPVLATGPDGRKYKFPTCALHKLPAFVD